MSLIEMKIGNGFKMRLEFVLEQVFEGLSDGGDHQARAFVALRLLKAAQSGILKLDDLKRIAQEALIESLQDSLAPQLLPQRMDQSPPASNTIRYD